MFTSAGLYTISAAILDKDGGKTVYMITVFVGGRMTGFDLGSCSDSPLIGPQNPTSLFDKLIGTGIGRYNSAPATVEFTFTDAGEPGRNDYGKIVIKQGTAVVATFEGNLKGGNQQSHAN